MRLFSVLTICVLALSSCAPGSFAPNRGRGIPMFVGERWSLELRDDKKGSAVTLNVNMNAPPQPGRQDPTQPNSYRVGPTGIWVLGPVTISNVEFVELRDGTREILVYAFKQNDVNQMFVEIDTTGPREGVSSCYLNGWTSESTRLEGSYSIRTPTKDNPNALVSQVAGRCVLSLRP